MDRVDDANERRAGRAGKPPGLRAFSGVYADAVDPRAFLTLSLDLWSAETVHDGLDMVAAAGGEVGILLDVRGLSRLRLPDTEDAERWLGIPDRQPDLPHIERSCR
jgi:hypothetical protein